MDEQVFACRVLLIQLSNELSDHSRKELHFIVGSIVPRKLRDDCTPTGTLHLFQCLFDRTLITDQQFDYLVRAFGEIGFSGAVEKLQDFRRIQIKPRTSSMRSRESAALNDESVSNTEVDRIGNVPIDVNRELSFSFSTPTTLSPPTDRSIVPAETMVSSESQLLAESYASHTKKHNQSSSPPPSSVRKLLRAQCTALTALLLVTNILSLLVFSLLYTRNCHPSSPLSLPSTITKELIYTTKEGLWHGVRGRFIQGQSFDDAKDLALSSSDRCTGVKLDWMDKYLVSIQFFYSNNRSSTVYHSPSNNEIDSSSRFSNTFMLTSNEEISKVVFYERPPRTYMKDMIVGIQFRTTEGRRSDLFGSEDGRFVSESFAGYTFGYAKGQQQQHSNRVIEMLQLVWYKSSRGTEKLNELPVSVVDTCSFNYTSEMADERVHATGVETSWYDLKEKFDRSGESCRPRAWYYRTISVEGPYLFAVVKGKYVFYHDAGRWTQYNSAHDVRFGVINSSTLHPLRSPRRVNQ